MVKYWCCSADQKKGKDCATIFIAIKAYRLVFKLRELIYLSNLQKMVKWCAIFCQ